LKAIIGFGIAILGLVCLIILYIAGIGIFNSSYRNFCNLHGREERWISYTIDITDDTYRLGTASGLGIGSTRREVIRAVNMRNFLIAFFSEGEPASRYIFFDEPFNLPGSTLGFYRVRTWNAIEFLFDDNDQVVKIRITPMN